MTESADINQTTVDSLVGMVTGIFASLSDEDRKSFTQFVTPLMTPLVASVIDTGDLTVTSTCDGNELQLKGEEVTQCFVAIITGQHYVQTGKDDVVDRVDELD